MIAGQQRVIENPISGERIVVRQTAAETGGQLFVFDLFLPPGAHVPARHAHPIQEEQFTVLSGRMRFRIGGRTILAGPGETVVVPIGFNLIRCGISEPVTKTVRSFAGGSIGLPPSAELTRMPAVSKLVAHVASSILMHNSTTPLPPRKREGHAAMFAGSFSAGRTKSGFRLQFSPEPTNELIFWD